MFKADALRDALINWDPYPEEVDADFTAPLDCGNNRLIRLSCPVNLYAIALIKGPERVETNAGITRIN